MEEQPHGRDAQHVRVPTGGAQLGNDVDEDGETPVRASGPRLRRKVFQEDTANASASGDDYAESNARQ